MSKEIGKRLDKVGATISPSLPNPSTTERIMGMANDCWPEGYFASIRETRRWINWQEVHIDKLEYAKYQEVAFWSVKPQALTLKGWFKSWINREVEVEREQLLWELDCISRHRAELQNMISLHPADCRSKWNSSLWDDKE